MKRITIRTNKMPEGFKNLAALPGTRARQYLSGQLDPRNLTEDPELWFICNDGKPGLLYGFKDSSSVVFDPVLQ